MSLGKDLMRGGLADKKRLKDFPAGKLRRGQKVEMEHTDKKDVAKEIASDHLTEDMGYYEKLKKMEKKGSIRHSDSDTDTRARDAASKAMQRRTLLGRVVGHPAFGPAAGGLYGLVNVAPHMRGRRGKERALLAAIGLGSGALGGYLGAKGGEYLGSKIQGKIPETMWHPDFKKEYQKALKKEKTSMANCFGKLKKMEKKSHVMRAFFDEVANLTKKAEGPPPLPKAAPSMGGRKPLLPEIKYPPKQTAQAVPPVKLPTSDKGVIERGKAYQNPGDITAKRIQRGKAKAETRSQPRPQPIKTSPAKPGVAPRVKGKGGLNLGHIGGAAALAAGMYASHKMNQPDQSQQYQ